MIILLLIAFLSDGALALRCSMNATSRFYCELSTVSCDPQMLRSPCTTEPQGDFKRGDFDGAQATCRSVNMSLVTPVDGPTLQVMASMCSTSFIGAKRRLPLNCDYHDVDANDSMPDIQDPSYWYFSEPSTPLVAMCNQSFHHEPCSTLFCENATSLPLPLMCSNRLHDRECGSYESRPWAGTHCVVCGRRRAPVVPMTTNVTTTTKITTTTTRTTTAPRITLPSGASTASTTGVSTTDHPTSTSDSMMTNSSSDRSLSLQVVPDTTVAAPSNDDTVVIIVAVLGVIVAIAMMICIILVVQRRRSGSPRSSDAAVSSTELAPTPASTIGGAPLSSEYSAWRHQNDNNYEKGDLIQ
jgi:hypothetical protein